MNFLRVIQAFALALVGAVPAFASARPEQLRALGALQPAVSADGKTVAVSYQGAIARLPAAGVPLVVLTRGEGWDVQPGVVAGRDA